MDRHAPGSSKNEASLGQLASENTPVSDVHLHPVEPRTVRVRLQARF